MSSTILFFIFIPFLAFVLLLVNLLFAPHNPYQEKESAFECGFHSFLGQNRTQFSISFFIFALLFLLFDLEILLVYPYIVSAYSNSIYGLLIMLVFFTALTIGLGFELGKKALNIDSRQSGLNHQSKSRFTSRNIKSFEIPQSISAKKSGFIFTMLYTLSLSTLFIFYGLLGFLFKSILDGILLCSYIKNRVPSDFLKNLLINKKLSLLEIIKYIFSRSYLKIYIPTLLFIISVSLAYFCLTGSTIINANSSYITIYVYTIIISAGFSFIFNMCSTVKFFSSHNLFSIFYSSLISFSVRLSVISTLPYMLSIFVFLDSLVMSERFIEISTMCTNFTKKLVNHIPYLNRFSFVFFEKTNRYLNIEIIKYKYNYVFSCKSKLIIYKPRISVPIIFRPLDYKVSITEIFNPMLKNKIIYESKMFIYNKHSASLSIYDVIISNYQNLSVSFVRVKEVAILKNYISTSNTGFFKLVNEKYNCFQYENKVIMLYPESMKINLSLSQSLIKYVSLINNSSNLSIIKNSNIRNLFICDNSINLPNIFSKSNTLFEKDIAISHTPKNIFDSKCDVIHSPPYIQPDVTVMMMHGITSLKDSFLPEREDLIRGLKQYKGWDEDNVFELLDPDSEYLEVCFFFNDLERIRYALDIAENRKEAIMRDEYLKENFYTLIKPLTTQYESFFYDEEGDLYDNPFSSLNELFIYLMTDEYEKHLSYVRKLSQEIGAEFINDKKMLFSDLDRDRVLLREYLKNFLVRSKAHVENILHEQDKEIMDKSVKGLLVEQDKAKPRKITNKSAYNKDYWEKHKAEILEKKKIYYENNKDAVLAKGKTYYENNKDAILAKGKTYYENNKDAILAKGKTNYESNKDKRLE